jgi:hypothetical protein
MNLFPSSSIIPSISRYRNLELGESDIVDNMSHVPPRESTEEEMLKDGIQRPKGNIYCRRCGYYYDNWEELFEHHREKHPWEDPEVLKGAKAEAEKYIKWWRELIGFPEPGEQKEKAQLG